jgi:signal peptidase I
MMQNKKHWITQDLKSGLIVFSLPILYVLILRIFNIPPLYLIVIFLILIIGLRLKSTKKKRSIITSLAYLILSGIFIRTFIQEARLVSSDSTISSFLRTNDRVNVDKLIYKFENPKRGDIILFLDKYDGIEYPAISRIIGMPSETIEVKNGTNYINGKILEGYNRSLGVAYQKSPPKEIPNGKYFVQGDVPEFTNEFNEREFVSKDKIIGKVVNRFWPISRIGNIQ